MRPDLFNERYYGGNENIDKAEVYTLFVNWYIV